MIMLTKTITQNNSDKPLAFEIVCDQLVGMLPDVIGKLLKMYSSFFYDFMSLIRALKNGCLSENFTSC